MSVSSADYSASSFYCSEAVNDMMVPSNAEVCDHISPTVSNSEDESSIVNVFDYSASNLSCNESVNDMVFSSNSVVCDHISSSVSDLEDESFIVHMFDSELHQMPVYDSIRRLDKFHEVVTARHNAIKWMFKVHAYYNFNPKTAYLSTNYLDRFLLLHGLPEGKMWSSQLLSVACLSLAAKMEETRVPLLLDLQVLEPKFMFKPKTVQRMELLVMAALKWRLCVITPFDFLDYFFEKLPCLDTNVNRFNCFLSRISDLILASCRVTDYMDYTPSTIAAAAVLLATDHKTISFHERVSNERVKRCQQLLKVHLIQMCQQAAGTEQQLLKPAPPSPVGVLDAASSGRSNTQKFLSMTPSQEETKDLRERRNGETVATL